MGALSRLRPAVAVAAAIAASGLLTGCQMAGPASASFSPFPTSSSGSTVSTSEFSTLDATGVDRIRTAKEARLDMSSGSLMKADVGVTADSYGPEINVQDSGTIALSILGPEGTVDAQTDRIRFNTTDERPDFSEVTYFLTAGTREELFTLIRDGVARYGINAETAEYWIQSVSEDPDGRSDFALDPGTATGLDVTYDLRYDGSKDTQVIIVHVSPSA
jgi:hypothetical protein